VVVPNLVSGLDYGRLRPCVLRRLGQGEIVETGAPPRALLLPGQRLFRGRDQHGTRDVVLGLGIDRPGHDVSLKTPAAPADGSNVRRLLAALVCALLTLGAPAVVLAKAKGSWAHAEIKLVTGDGLMGGDPATFKPDAPLTRAALDDLVSGLTDTPAASAAGVATAPVTLAGLNQTLVRSLDFGDDARRFFVGARASGLRPPARFGSEVVARLLGLRKNHPASTDDLELLPNDVATRAEAAYSAAQILRFNERTTASVEHAASEFELPQYTPWQRRVLQTAVDLIGYPYVWGGTSTGQQTLFGVTSRGGFDCSGYVWRVFKLDRYPGGNALARTLRGRTAAQMAGEVPPAKRIALADLEPGDVVFFGPGGRRARAAAIDHAGIYLGDSWMINSSRYGVALARVDGWNATRFAWGRRPLAEAGLA
jgi:cell wall-associated NlpC family hydrolase